METGRFRKKRSNFAQVSNAVLRNPEISLKAKGLYSLIQSYITLDNFILYKSFLQKQCKEGNHAFVSAWKELKDNGLLIQYKLKTESGEFYYEYELLDKPKNKSHIDNPYMDNSCMTKSKLEYQSLNKLDMDISPISKPINENAPPILNTSYINILFNNININIKFLKINKKLVNNKLQNKLNPLDREILAILLCIEETDLIKLNISDCKKDILHYIFTDNYNKLQGIITMIKRREL